MPHHHHHHTSTLRRRSLKICLESESSFLFRRHDARLLVYPYTLFKEIGFAFQRYILHKVERVIYSGAVQFWVTQFRQETSATNSTYWPIRRSFIPIREHFRASVMNLRSISTASRTTFKTVFSAGLHSRYENNKHAKSQCNTSSWLMSSLEKARHQIPFLQPEYSGERP